MAQKTLKKFLQKLQTELETNSDAFRKGTLNRRATTILIAKSRIAKLIFDTLKRVEKVNKSAFDQYGGSQKLYNDFSERITKGLDTAFDEIRTNFRTLRTSHKGDVIIRRTDQNSIKVTIFQIEGGKTDLYTLAKRQYLGDSSRPGPLKKFYENLIDDIRKSLGVAGELRRGGKSAGTVSVMNFGTVQNLEHELNKSNIQYLIEDSIYTAVKDVVSKSRFSRAAIQQEIDALNLGTFIKIEKNAKTGIVSVFVGDQLANARQGATKEQSYLKEVKTAVAEALIKLDTAHLSGSDSLAEGARKKVAQLVLDKFMRGGATIVRQENLKISGDTSSTRKINPKVTGSSIDETRTKLTRKPTRKGKSSPRRKAQPQSPLALLGLVNKRLKEQVRANMQEPALQNQTGRFASSVRVTDIITTPQGFPSVGYTYAKNPYQVYETASGSKFASADRDPRTLIDKSIREVMAEFAIGRFYTRRV